LLDTVHSRPLDEAARDQRSWESLLQFKTRYRGYNNNMMGFKVS